MTAFCEAPLVDDADADAAALCALAGPVAAAAEERTTVAKLVADDAAAEEPDDREELDEDEEALEEADVALDDEAPEVEPELLAEAVLDMPLALPDEVVVTDTAAVTTAAAPL